MILFLFHRSEKSAREYDNIHARTYDIRSHNWEPLKGTEAYIVVEKKRCASEIFLFCFDKENTSTGPFWLDHACVFVSKCNNTHHSM